jgi:hypothetical protein
VQRGIQLLLDLLLHPNFEGAVLFVTVRASMIERSMAVRSTSGGGGDPLLRLSTQLLLADGADQRDTMSPLHKP